MVTFYAGQKVTAAQLESLVDYTTRIEKSASEDVTSSTTYQDDNEFVFPGLLSGSTYEVWGTLIYVGGAGDIKFQWTWPSGGSGYFSWGAYGLHDQWVDSATNRDFQAFAGGKNSASPTDQFWYGAVGASNRPVRFDGRMVLGASGTLTLQWAQLSSSGTATTLSAGSWVAVKKLS